MSFRLFPTAVFSGGITFVLFWIMTALIAVPDVVPTDVPDLPAIKLVEVRTEDPPLPEPEVVPERREIEPVPIDITTSLDTGEGLLTIAQEGPTAIPIGETSPTLAIADGDAVPLVRVPPRYPERALARGLEGRVLVGFTVDRAGNVREARVLAAEPPNVFDRAALEAVSQWKYNPRVVHGRPTERKDMKIALPFRLEGGSDRSP